MYQPAARSLKARSTHLARVLSAHEEELGCLLVLHGSIGLLDLDIALGPPHPLLAIILGYAVRSSIGLEMHPERLDRAALGALAHNDLVCAVKLGGERIEKGRDVLERAVGIVKGASEGGDVPGRSAGRRGRVESRRGSALGGDECGEVTRREEGAGRKMYAGREDRSEFGDARRGEENVEAVRRCVPDVIVKALG